MARSVVLRITCVLGALSLMLLAVQPQSAAAQTETYTLTKTFSTPFACNTAATAPPTGLTFSQVVGAAAGQCVAVNVSITNNTSSTLPITNLQLSDVFPALSNGQLQLIGQANYGCPRANPAYTCNVTPSSFFFSTNGASYSLPPTPGSNTGTETFVVQVNPSATCGTAINNTATAPVVQNGSGMTATNFSQTNPGAATATVNVTGCTAPGLAITKAVSVNGLGYGVTATARPNDQLQYAIQVTNTTGATIPGVTVTDILQPGQTPVLYPGLPCTYTAPTMTCTLGDLAPGASRLFGIITFVNGGFSGTIQNVATAQSTNGTSVTSNPPTTVFVGSPTPYPVAASQLILCGTVTYVAPVGATSGSITIGSITVTFAAGTPVVGVVNGANQCVTFTFDPAGRVTSVTASSNLAAVTVVCGVYGGTTTAGTILVSGMPLAYVPSATFPGLLVPGVTYCFLINGSGQAYAVLTSTPTSITSFKPHYYGANPDAWARPE